MVKVFVNGSFDVLHRGHIELLNWAASLGSHLLVALDSDRRITEKKGVERPFNDWSNRSALMSNLRMVDAVKMFDSDQELIDIIKEYRPDVMVVGGDWRGKPIIGSQWAGRVEFFDRVNGESTTKTLQRYIDRR